jgi:hypothetical protein
MRELLTLQTWKRTLNNGLTTSYRACVLGQIHRHKSRTIHTSRILFRHLAPEPMTI